MEKPPTVDEEARGLDLAADGKEMRRDFRRTKVVILIVIVAAVIAIAALAITVRR